MTKRKLHKNIDTGNAHLCGAVRFAKNGTCCSERWRGVTCKNCLRRKGKR